MKQQQQVQQQPPIVQPEDSLRRPPVYFGDRFPVSPNQQHSSSRVAIDDQGDQGQFHLYGLQLGELQIQLSGVYTLQNYKICFLELMLSLFDF